MIEVFFMNEKINFFMDLIITLGWNVVNDINDDNYILINIRIF
jgi:hypothetical protein